MNALGYAVLKGYGTTDGVASSIESLDHLHGKWVWRECCRIVNGVCFPLSFRNFIERGESFDVGPPLQFIHGPLGHNIVIRQFINGNTIKIWYVEGRLVRHDRCGCERLATGLGQI